jgi:hypothetical protein
MRGIASIASVVMTCGLVSAVNADSIGINFVGGGNGGNNGTLASTDTAGVVPQQYFNEITGVPATVVPLVNSSGDSTPAVFDVTVGSGVSTYSAGITGTDPNSELMNGYIDPFNSDGGLTFTVSNIPYAEYDVYVYSSSDHNGDRSSSMTVNGTAYSGLVGHYDPSVGYVVSTPAQPGEYDVFADQTSSTLTIYGARNTTGFAGVQIVNDATPEPVALGTISVGAAGLLLRRRKA